MIKFATIGTSAPNKPNLVLDKEIPNYALVTVDGTLYFIHNIINGHDSYIDNKKLPAGEMLRGFVVKALEDQELVIDAKHVTGGIDSLEKGATLVVDEATYGVKTGAAAGVHFVVTETGVELTEKAIKVKVAIA